MWKLHFTIADSALGEVGGPGASMKWISLAKGLAIGMHRRLSRITYSIVKLLRSTLCASNHGELSSWCNVKTRRSAVTQTPSFSSTNPYGNKQGQRRLDDGETTAAASGRVQVCLVPACLGSSLSWLGRLICDKNTERQQGSTIEAATQMVA